MPPNNLDDPGGSESRDKASHVLPIKRKQEEPRFFSWLPLSKKPSSNYYSRFKSWLSGGEQPSRKYQHESTHVDRASRVAYSGIACASADQHERSLPEQSSTFVRSLDSFSGLQDGQLQHDVECAQVPQNTKTSDDSHVSSQKDGIDLEEARNSSSDVKHRSVVFKTLNIIDLTNWLYALTSKKQHYSNGAFEGSGGYDRREMSYPSENAPYTCATLLEKAILRRSPSGRYIGLYPHSADPPIHNVAEYPQGYIPTKNPAYYQGPSRSQARQQIQRHTPFGTHITSTFAYRLLSFLLQVIRSVAYTSFSYIGFLQPPQSRRKLRNQTKHSNSHLHIMQDSQYCPSYCVEEFHILDTMDEDILNHFVGEDPQSLFLNMPYLYQEFIPHVSTQIPATIDFTPELEYLAVNGPHFFSPLLTSPPPPMHPMQPFEAASSTPEGGFGYNSTHPPSPNWGDFMDFPGSPTPAPAATDTGVEFLQSEDMLPGLSNDATSQSVTPLTEGLETPTFTPRSIASPPAAPRRRTFVCGEESCGHKEFKRRCDLSKHLKTHIKHLKCVGCDQCFSTEKDRQRHYATVHEKLKPYSCELCDEAGGRSFSRKDNLRDHQKRVHGVEKKKR